MKKYYNHHTHIMASDPLSTPQDDNSLSDDNYVLFDDEDPLHSLVKLNCITTVNPNDDPPIIRIKYYDHNSKASAIFIIISMISCLAIAFGISSHMNAIFPVMLLVISILLISLFVLIFNARIAGYLRFYPDHVDMYHGIRKNFKWFSIKRHASVSTELISYTAAKSGNRYVTLYKIEINGHVLATNLQEYDARFLHSYLKFYFSGVTNALPNQEIQTPDFSAEREIEFITRD